MTTLIAGEPNVRPNGVIRQGITIEGINVVLVAMSMDDIDTVRAVTEAAVNQHGLQLLKPVGHPTTHGDRQTTAPIVSGGVLIGYVELSLEP